MQRGEKAKKRERGVFHRQNGHHKICFDGGCDIFFLNICEKHPLVGENCIQSLKKIFYKYLTYFLDAAGWPNIWFLSSLSLSMIESNEKCSKLFWTRMSTIDNRSFQPLQIYLKYLDAEKMRVKVENSQQNANGTLPIEMGSVAFAFRREFSTLPLIFSASKYFR